MTDERDNAKLQCRSGCQTNLICHSNRFCHSKVLKRTVYSSHHRFPFCLVFFLVSADICFHYKKGAVTEDNSSTPNKLNCKFIKHLSQFVFVNFHALVFVAVARTFHDSKSICGAALTLQQTQMHKKKS
jgi:hypothetical protein